MVTSEESLGHLDEMGHRSQRIYVFHKFRPLFEALRWLTM